MEEIPKELLDLAKDIKPLQDALKVILKDCKPIKAILINMMQKHLCVENGRSTPDERANSRRKLFAHLYIVKRAMEIIKDAACLGEVDVLYDSMCEEFNLNELVKQLDEAIMQHNGN